MNTKRYRYLQKLQRKRQGYSKDSWESIINLKEDADEIDPFFIYRMNLPGQGNGPPFVFKTLITSLQIAMLMDCESVNVNPLQEEEAFFDAMHSRVKGYKRLCLYVMEPASMSLIRIATMEVKS